MVLPAQNSVCVPSHPSPYKYPHTETALRPCPGTRGLPEFELQLRHLDVLPWAEVAGTNRGPIWHRNIGRRLGPKAPSTLVTEIM